MTEILFRIVDPEGGGEPSIHMSPDPRKGKRTPAKALALFLYDVLTRPDPPTLKFDGREIDRQDFGG